MLEYKACHNPNAFFASSSKIHAFINSNLGELLCGTKVSIGWEEIEDTKITCKKCLKQITPKL